ncbi:MAG: exosortase [Desulfobulbaceae bacterium]|nr:exosortase [Desulfobulbaceae bacterium]
MTILSDLMYPARKAQWVVLTVLIVIMYRGVLPQWGYELWDDPNYSHGLLIPFLSLYLIREKMGELLASQRKSNLIGLVVVILAVLLFIVGYIGAEFFSKRLSLILLLYGSILFLEGWTIAGILAFPVGILFFAVPLPYILYNSIAFPLKLIASQIAVWFIALSGMPVFREGNVITLPHSTMEVVDACSGIRSLMTLFTLAFLLGYFHHKKWWKRLVVILLATPIAVFANALRVTMTGILTKYDPAWGHGTLHDLTGWLVFVVSFVLLAGSSFLLCDKQNAPNTLSEVSSEN